MSRLLYRLAQYGEISWLSCHFAAFIAAQAKIPADETAALTAAMLCEASQRGDVCLDLAELAGKPMFACDVLDDADVPRAAALEAWRRLLLQSDCVAGPGARAPMTLDDDRLYLNRFWYYEDRVAGAILDLLSRDGQADPAQAQSRLDTLFGDGAALDADQQRAVLNAASRAFSVISGGPGSGKTSSVVRIIALLLAQDPNCRIALAAPTGKAAARMMESIRQHIDRLDIDPRIKQTVPREAQTIHRLLGYGRRDFVHNAEHPLAVDCVVVDEASMVDLKLMFQLVAALPRTARLVLLGDRDQLASVAAGNVLGDITGHGHDPASTAAPVAPSVCLLRTNYRFTADSAIGELAARVNAGRVEAALELLRREGQGLRWYASDSEEIDAAALEWICAAYAPIFACASPAEALEVFEASRVLCATNRGPLGVDSMGRLIGDRLLARAGLPVTDLYHGLPIMISRNHHELGLYNGDSGILWRDDEGLRACFRDAGGIRMLALNRLPDFTPAWVSTVHKSQGSEFDSVLLILPPDEHSEVSTRELLYTAITRARREFQLHAPATAVTGSIERLTHRHSGLAAKLGWPSRRANGPGTA